MWSWDSSLSLQNTFCDLSLVHPLGCDFFGRDLLSLILLGMVFSIGIAILVVAVKLLIAITLGTSLALLPKRATHWGDVLLNIFLSFPNILFSLLIITFFKQNLFILVISLVSLSWAPLTLVFKTLAEQMAAKSYIEASLSLGVKKPMLIFRHFLPAFYGQIKIEIPNALAHVILLEASFSFLGLYGSFTKISLGSLIAEGRYYLLEYPRLALIPGLCLFFLVWGLNLGVFRKFRLLQKL